MGLSYSVSSRAKFLADGIFGRHREGPLRYFKKLALLTCVALSLVACGSTADFDRYKDSIAAFKTATDQTSTAVAAHILTIRDVDRERMFTQLSDTRNPCELLWVAKRKQAGTTYSPTDCAFLAIQVAGQGRFSREAIAARRQVFDVLNEYTALLAAVAESDAPARWDSAAKGLGAGAQGLLETIESADETKKKQLGQLKGLVGNEGALTKLISFAGQEWINFQRAKALDEIIERGKPEIDRISRLLRQDFKFVQRREAYEEGGKLSNATFAYAEAVDAAVRDPSKDGKRTQALAEVKRVLLSTETRLVEIQSIGSTMDAFDDAHAALVEYAQSTSKPRDIGALVAAVKRYAAAAKDIYNAFKTSQEAAGA